MGSLGIAVIDLEWPTSNHSDRLTVLEAKVDVLTTLMDSLSKKCEDLEGISKWNNIA